MLHQSITSESNHVSPAASRVLDAQNDAITLLLSVERRVMKIAEHWTVCNNHRLRRLKYRVLREFIRGCGGHRSCRDFYVRIWSIILLWGMIVVLKIVHRLIRWERLGRQDRFTAIGELKILVMIALFLP